MAVTVSGTSITFNDATVQTTAASTPSTAFGDVGTYAVLLITVNTNLATGATIAGSSLRYNYTGNSSNSFGAPFVGGRSRSSVNYDGGGTALSGTWRKLSTGPTYIFRDLGCGLVAYDWVNALYVRIS